MNVGRIKPWEPSGDDGHPKSIRDDDDRVIVELSSAWDGDDRHLEIDPDALPTILAAPLLRAFAECHRALEMYGQAGNRFTRADLDEVFERNGFTDINTYSTMGQHCRDLRDAALRMARVIN